MAWSVIADSALEGSRVAGNTVVDVIRCQLEREQQAEMEVNTDQLKLFKLLFRVYLSCT